MMPMVARPVSVVTYAIVTGEVAMAAPPTVSTMLLKALCESDTGQRLPDHSRSHPYQTPASVSVTITVGTTIHLLPALWYVVVSSSSGRWKAADWSPPSWGPS